MRTPKFTIFKGKDGQYYFHLRAKNGRIILQSEGYTQKHNCEKGIEAVKSICVKEDGWIYVTGDWTGEAYLKPKPNYWYFKVEAENGKIIGMSEMYTSQGNALRGIKSVQRCAVAAVIVDKTKD